MKAYSILQLKRLMTEMKVKMMRKRMEKMTLVYYVDILFNHYYLLSYIAVDDNLNDSLSTLH